MKVKRCPAAIDFESFPVWTGVKDRPGVDWAAPLRIGWDKRGFIAQTTPEEVKKSVIAAYAAAAYRHITPPPEHSGWAATLGQKKIQLVAALCGDSLRKANVLEIGAGSLFLAKHFLNTENISRYTVVDPTLRQESDSEAICVVKDYFPAKGVSGPFDVVISLSCLEHVPDPVLFLEDIRNVLAKNGKAIFVFPNTEEGLKCGNLGMLVHEHMSYLTRDAALRIFEAAGLSILQILADRETLTIAAAPSDREPPDKKSYPTDPLLIHAASTYPDTTERVCNLINDIANGQESVAFHGASCGLNAALFLSETSQSDRIHIFDGDHEKTGKFLPAFNGAINRAQDAFYKKMDRVYITPDSYYDEIRDFLISFHGLSASRIFPLFP